MKRLWPRSLTGQLVLIVLAALIAGQTLSLLIFADERRLALRAANREQVLTRIAGLVKLLAETPPELHPRILAALDNLDRATDAAKKAGDSGPLVQGVSATASMFLEILKRHGVAKMDVGPGTAFDPNKHQAVAQQPTNDYDPGAVVQVLQSGFTIHDRVLRPASVVVAAEPPAGGSHE